MSLPFVHSDYQMQSRDDGLPACDPSLRQTLPAGKCNLYKYPVIKFADKGASFKHREGSNPREAEKRKELDEVLLAKLMLALYEKPLFAKANDKTGATPLLALQVGNPSYMYILYVLKLYVCIYIYIYIHMFNLFAKANGKSGATPLLALQVRNY